mgnify:FL=1
MTATERERFLNEHIKWVERIADRMNKYNDQYRPMSRADLIACGIAGLCDALNKYDESYRALFKTYASRRVEGAILDGIRDWSYHTRTQRPEIVSFEGLTATIVTEERKYKDEPRFIPNTDASIDLEILLGKLPRDEEEVLRLRYYADMTRKDIALTIGCSIRHVDDLRTRGLNRMREMMRD